ncbi:helix-turn-helix transcriptional regulator [Demequina subtropica]|uniref:helix-turn-helix transcriptional regulator n=1 Tax=Demequina subtropica TaxID=1638989 RepID=UPI000781738E|nr:WYL domain-containing protein [Demequina subtropica]
MRADRLIATLLLMQARGRVTAAEVAHELEVSVATARRDLEALSTAGIPVYPQPGRGGGWSLVGGSRTDLTGLSATEAQALFLLIGTSRTDRSAEATSALRKLVRALPATFRADAEAAGRAVIVDRETWGAAHRDDPTWLVNLQRAVVRHRQVELTYAGRDGESRRVVDPWALVDKGGRWYLIAGTPAGRRTFRVDRIVAVTVEETPAARPAEDDLEGIWDSVVEDVESHRGRVTATAVTPPSLLPVLGRLFGRHLEVLQEDDARAEVRVASHTARSVAEHLAGLGAAVEVIEPPEVRQELVALAAEISDLYGGGGS